MKLTKIDEKFWKFEDDGHLPPIAFDRLELETLKMLIEDALEKDNKLN